MLCKNTGKLPARFQIDGVPGKRRKYNVAPGASVEIPDGYCKPYLSPSRRPMKPIIQQLAAAMVPQPGQYAPGMDPEFHELGALPEGVQTQLEKMAAMVETLSAEVARLSGRGAVPQPAADPGEGETADDDDEVDPDGDEEDEDDDGGEAAGDDDPDVAQLLKQSKATLLSIARELGAEGEEKMTKAQLAEAILAKRNEPAE